MPDWLDGDWFCTHGVTVADLDASGASRGLRSLLTETSTRTSLPALLRHADWNSMAASLETRVPFLTTSLAEAATALPDDYLAGSDGATKAIMRQVLRGLVPEAILSRRDKVGFVTQEAWWLVRNAACFDKRFADDRLDGLPALKGEGVRRVWRATNSGKP